MTDIDVEKDNDIDVEKDNVINMHWWSIQKLLQKIAPYTKTTKINTRDYKMVLKTRAGFVRVDDWIGKPPLQYRVPIPFPIRCFCAEARSTELPDFSTTEMRFVMKGIDESSGTVYYEEA
jgi:hypothetical protein